MEKITIRAFRAPEDAQRCRTFMIEHENVLKDLGVASVVKYDETWMSDPDTIVFVAEHESLGMVAGIRLQRAKTGTQLPMERALNRIEPGLIDHLDTLAKHGNAELGALWNAHRFAGNGLPHLLIAAAVSTANQANLTSVVCFVAEYIAPYCSMTGFQAIEQFGNKGCYNYPLPEMRSYVMVVPDTRSLSHANPIERHRALSLRLRPNQVRSEQPKRNELEVTYDLLLDREDETYTAIAAERQRYAA
jgi:hypothetical protein